MTPDNVDLLLKASAAIVALLGLFKGFREYRIQGSLKRAEFFLRKSDRFFEDERFKSVRLLIEKGKKDPTLEGESVSRDDRKAYLTFFEEIALLDNSGLLDHKVANYMYGYFVVSCLDSKLFWVGLKKSEKQWGLFFWYAESLKNERSNSNKPIWTQLEF
jgi:hypothetical protein